MLPCFFMRTRAPDCSTAGTKVALYDLVSRAFTMSRVLLFISTCSYEVVYMQQNQVPSEKDSTASPDQPGQQSHTEEKKNSGLMEIISQDVTNRLKKRKVLTDRDKANIRTNLFQCGALLVISVYIFQGIISSSLSDTAQRVSLYALAVAIPLLAGCFLVFWSEQHFESYAKGWNAFFQFCSNIGALAALTGVGAIIWHLSESAAWVFIAIAVFMILVSQIYMSPEIMNAQIGNPHYDNRETLD